MGYFRRICNELPKAVAIESNMYLEVSFICMLGIYIISRLTNKRAHTLRCSWQTKGGGVAVENGSTEGMMEKCSAKRRIFNFLPAEKIFFVIRENIH